MRKILLVAIILLFPVLGSYIERPIIHSYKQLPSAIRTQIQCLADNIYFEARGEGTEGQIAVALVTLNRTKSDTFPSNVCSVVKQRIGNVCQFTWYCNLPAAIHIHRGTMQYEFIQRLATDIYLNAHRYRDITMGAVFYHANHVGRRKLGEVNIEKTAQIGRHIFYKERQ